MFDIPALRKFYTERREKSVAVTCDKSSTPMLWLDSSVLIDFAKIENNENVERIRKGRLKKLRETARRLIRAGKLICPEWDQNLEFKGKRLEPQIRRVVSDLSCGAHCVPYAGVKDQQIAIGLKAYLDSANTVNIPARIHFYRDPARAVREAISLGYIVEANMPKPKEWIAKADNDKRETQKATEELRRRYSGGTRSFEEQLAFERVGESDVMLQMVGDFMKNVAIGKHGFWGFMGVQGFLQHQAMWRRIGGPGPELPAIYSFMRSPYYWELPIEDVACRLCADLLVKHFPVKSGDSYDIQHLAMAIPVAHYVVADKAMVDRCERLHIATKWGTKLYSNRTVADLCDELDSAL